MVVHAFELGRQGRQISVSEASLLYRAKSQTARATQRNAISRKKKKKQTKKQRGRERTWMLTQRMSVHYWCLAGVCLG